MYSFFIRGWLRFAGLAALLAQGWYGELAAETCYLTRVTVEHCQS